MEADHHLAEQRGGFGMLGKIIEERDSVRFFETSFAGLNGIDQMIPATLRRAAGKEHG